MVFLNRFEAELAGRSIPSVHFRLYLPYCLSGALKEAYYNNISLCPTYADARIVLLNAGGYSLTECLSSFPLKFRHGGSKSLIQWFNHWRYKFNIMISNLPFSNSMHPTVRDEVANMMATIGVVAGLPQDHRDAVLNRPCPSNARFIHDCNSWYLLSHQAARYQNIKYSRNNFQSNQYQSTRPISQNQPSRQTSYHSTPHPPSSSHSTQHPYSSHSPSQPIPTPYPRRELSTVTCFRCNRLGHYANNCTFHPSSPPTLNRQPDSNPAPSTRDSAHPNSQPCQSTQP